MVSVGINGVIGALGYWLRFYSMSKLTPLLYALLSYVGILMSFVYGWWFNAEQLTWNKLVGAVCILIPNLWIKVYN
jgi:drug/metabolite transporter (DMT)-like permease